MKDIKNLEQDTVMDILLTASTKDISLNNIIASY